MRGGSAIERVLRPVLVVVSVLLVATVAFQVVARYVFAAPPVWTTEASTLALVYLTFLGAALASERGTGFRITTFRDRYVRTPVGRGVWRAIQWFEVALVVLLAALGVVMVITLWLQNAVALGVSIGWFALAVPLGLAGMAVGLVRSARRASTPAPTLDREFTG